MILIKPDMNRRITIPGVPGPILRPVDVDQAGTGFSSLRTLRIYRFEAGSMIEGHAEEDEVFIVLLSGSVELTMSEDASKPNTAATPANPVRLSAPDAGRSVCCAAYLPPQAAYKLVANRDADVAYARATPSGTRPAKVFSSFVSGAGILLEETDYAERLRLRLVHIDERKRDSTPMLCNESEARCEALVHVRTIPATGVARISESSAGPTLLDSWDTIALAPGDRVTLEVDMGSSLLALVVFAS